MSNDQSGKPLYDPAGYWHSGPFQLTDEGGGSVQSGDVSIAVAKGDTIGFWVRTKDNLFGNASLTISNFSAPVPEPASLALMALGLVVVASAAAERHRRER